MTAMARVAVPAALLAAWVAAGASAGAAQPRSGCGGETAVGSRALAYAAFVRHSATAFRQPARGAFAHFARTNVNGYPTLFLVRAVRTGRDCRPTWFRVELPLRPNGSTGYVRSEQVRLAKVRTRIVVDLSERRLTLFRRGRPVQSVVAGVGPGETPTPTGSFYVNQRLVPADPNGPWGPAALGISAFSPTLRAWPQGGPVAIHGTSDPGSVGRAESHGCVRLRNRAMLRLFAVTPAGTPVLIHR